MTILVARLANGRMFYLNSSHSREHLRSMRSETQFFCPACAEAVRLKVGEVMIPHFAHFSLSECAAYSEPESPLHLRGKLQLHQWAESRGPSSELEKYLPAIRQRADLLIGDNTAIEFQCSAIPQAEVLSRTEGYRSLGFRVHWLKGVAGTYADSIQLVRLKTHETSFFESSNGILFCRMYSPAHEHFIYFSHLLYVSGSRWIVRVRILPLALQQYPFLVPAPLGRQDAWKMLLTFKQARQRFIHSQKYVRRKYQHPFWLCTYALRMDPERLPPVIGVPLPNGHLIQCHSVIWQLQAALAIDTGKGPEELLRQHGLPLLDAGRSAEVKELLRQFGQLYGEWKQSQMTEQQLDRLLIEIACKSL